MRHLRRTVPLVLPLALAALVASGCAGSAARIHPTGSVPAARDLARYDRLAVQVVKADDVKATEQDLSRIRDRIVAAVRAKQPGRFREVDAPSSSDPEVPVLQVAVRITRYDKGSAFARAMLAGLGQIHVDGQVVLTDRGNGAVHGRYEVKKTFAWGGIYGASTTIEDVEGGFAQGVTAIVLQEAVE